jgi:hypothetical protein
VDEFSYLKIDSLSAGAGATLRFGAVSNRTYTVEYTDDLGAGAWSRLADVPARSTNRVETLADAAASAQRSYRLVTPRRP